MRVEPPGGLVGGLRGDVLVAAVPELVPMRVRAVILAIPSPPGNARDILARYARDPRLREA